MFKHVIFDCDGVLVDSEPLSMEIDRDILAENGIAMTVAEVGRRFIGLTFEAFVEKIESDYRIKLPRDVSEDKNRRLLALYEKKLAAAPGVHGVLVDMKLPMSIASNSPRHRVEAAFRIAGLARYFGDRIVTFEDVARAKPAPDIYLEAARRARVPAGACLAIEDSKAGVASAMAAGCTVIGYTGLAHDGAASARALTRLGARAVISRHEDLPAAITAVARL
ncbi:MAG: HAD family hydrolase [Parvibaculaceae bacterium]